MTDETRVERVAENIYLKLAMRLGTPLLVAAIGYFINNISNDIKDVSAEVKTVGSRVGIVQAEQQIMQRDVVHIKEMTDEKLKRIEGHIFNNADDIEANKSSISELWRRKVNRNPSSPPQ